jgi:hypothetical protein
MGNNNVTQGAVDELNKITKLKQALRRYVLVQSRMLDRWSESDDLVKKELWQNLHSCETEAIELLEEKELHTSSLPPSDKIVEEINKIRSRLGMKPQETEGRNEETNIHQRRDLEKSKVHVCNHCSKEFTGWTSDDITNCYLTCYCHHCKHKNSYKYWGNTPPQETVSERSGEGLSDEISFLYKIAFSVEPYNESEKDSWIETARNICKQRIDILQSLPTPVQKREDKGDEVIFEQG